MTGVQTCALPICSSCGARQGSGESSSEAQNQPNTGAPASSGQVGFAGAISRLVGSKTTVKAPLNVLFGGIFKSHTKSEAEDMFICGTESTTPDITRLSNAWPSPWLFTRVFLVFATAFFILHLCCDRFSNTNSIPGTLILGSFMVPIALLFFFFELNIPKNISFFTTIKIFLIGGCLSLICSLILYSIIPVGELNFTGAILVGVIEELGKLAAVAFFIWLEKKKGYTVNGLLIGAAVGAGFAAFESAGYAFRFLLSYGYSGMMEVIFVRGFLAPGGHVVWAAISGYAIMLALDGKPFSMDFLSKSAFWKLFLVPVVLHSIWDMPISIGSEFYLIPILMTVASWAVIIVMIGASLAQIASIVMESEKDRIKETPVESTPFASISSDNVNYQ